MTRLQLGLLSLGVLLIILAVWIAAFILEVVMLSSIIPLIILSNGLWMIILAGIKKARVESSSFSTLSWGMLLVVIGGSWYMSNLGMPLAFTIVFTLGLLGILAITTAFKSSRK